MIKRAQESIDPATQLFGTSIDTPGTQHSVKNTQVGVTGVEPTKKNPTSSIGQRPPEMRKTDFGVRIAMDKNYVDGFIDKCASCGLDAEAVVKQAQMAGMLGKAWGAAKPVLKRLNPWNLVSAPSKLWDEGNALIGLRGRISTGIAHENPNLLENLPALRSASSAATLKDPTYKQIMNQVGDHTKNFLGGAAGAAGIYGAANAAMPPPPPPTLEERFKSFMQQHMGM